MKRVLTIALIICFSNSYGQIDRLKGIWVTKSNELIEIKDTKNSYDNFNTIDANGFNLGLNVFLYGDTLSFQNYHYSYSGNSTGMVTDRYDLLILKNNDTSLVVRPITELSSFLFSDKKELTFTKHDPYTVEPIKLEKIIYNTTFCYGSCPEYHLEIDSSLNAKLIVKINNWEDSDTSKSGYFKGKICKDRFRELEDLIQSCNLRTLQFNNADCCDGSIITLIIYYNGRRKYLKSMFPPKIASKLINYLNGLCSSNEFERVDKKFDIEQ